MIILDATPKSLEFKLGGAVSANELPFQASYLDLDAFAPDNQDGVSNGAAAVTLVAAPGGSETRQVKQFTIFNDDTAAADVIVQYNNNGTIRQMTEISVPANGTLVYTDGEGFRVINSNGEVLTPGIDTTAFAEIAAAETISGAWTFTTSPTLNDNVKLLLGDAGDAAIYYDTADLNIDPQEVGSGDLLLVPNGGKVGIGTASPQGVLHITKTAGALPAVGTVDIILQDNGAAGNSAVFSLLSGVTGASQLVFGDTDDIDIGKISYNHATDLMQFVTSTSARMSIDSSGSIGIGETAPGTLLDMASEAPYLTLHNTTHEDGDGGRESRIIFEGEQSGGELTALAWIEASHDGAVDDEKGKLLFYANDGDDGAAPTLGMTLNSAAMLTLVGDFDHDGSNIGLFATAPVAQQTVTGARDVPEEALADLLTKLALYGLIVDNTTAS